MANTIFVGEKYFCQDGFFREKKTLFSSFGKNLATLVRRGVF